MKRDLELIRKLLFYFENREEVTVMNYNKINNEEELRIDSYSGCLIVDHIILLYEAGYIDGEPEKTSTGRIIAVHPYRLTWDGHEFLEAMRNESIFKKAVNISKEKSLDLPIEIFKSLAQKLITNELSI